MSVGDLDNSIRDMRGEGDGRSRVTGGDVSMESLETVCSTIESVGGSCDLAVTRHTK